MGTEVIVYEKLKSGELSCIDQRKWSSELLGLLNHTNYITINEQEYEMIEGRINVDKEVMELLVVSAQRP
ncbi:hypothetical protein NV379_07460 [Paenibacillus sp. N1-5-1-14]|uniref:hypothetical protein n=1 Tax=Paenibacillus radicibacter TaxID=2972488 RepID=UPI002159216A|nr:hypothetical protein [Paenibacillus radicibacter]MCR8642499.1 hypothetical protein [Paenibacillus radicibacter]